MTHAIMFSPPETRQIVSPDHPKRVTGGPIRMRHEDDFMANSVITNNWCLVRTVFVVLAATAVTPAAGQRGPVVLRVPASTRALGLGNVFVVGSTDSDAVFYNAAFPDRLRGAGAAVQWWGSRATLYTVSGATEWWGGGLALGVRALDYGGGAAAGGAGPRFGEGDLRASTATVVSERAASLAYARRVKSVRGAVTAHLAEQRTSAGRDVIAGADVATGVEAGLIAAGLAVRNIGPGYQAAGLAVDQPVQLQLVAAAIRPAPVGALDVLPVLGVMYEVDGELIPAGGVEVSYWPVSGRTFSLRLGARRADDGVRPWTVGAGFTGDRLILDYALVPLVGERLVHRFGVRWR